MQVSSNANLWYSRSQLYVRIWTEKAFSWSKYQCHWRASERVSFNETLLNKSQSLKHSVCSRGNATQQSEHVAARYVTNYPTGLKNGVVFQNNCYDNIHRPITRNTRKLQGQSSRAFQERSRVNPVFFLVNPFSASI